MATTEDKNWSPKVSEDQLWRYNCIDCVRTREVGAVELRSIDSMGLTEVEAFQQALFWPVLKAMQIGVRIDKKARDAFALELQEEMAKREQFFFQVLGHPLNPRSNPVMTKLFYTDLGVPPIWSRAKKGVPAHVTCDDDALDKIMSKEPLTRPLIRAIQEYRSLGVFLSTFVLAPLDVDSRMRCSYNICGTETYRFNSSANAFDSGTNLQNVPKGGEEDGLTLPNVRKLFVPDPGFTFFDMDLDRADLQVVVWEADDAELKAALRMGVDMHLFNAYTLSQRQLPPLEELVESHPKYLDHRIPYKKERQLAKAFIHGTNYGGGARTMAVAAGVTVHQADRFQKIYFGRYPGLKDWHTNTEAQLRTHRFVSNKFGYRRYYFDRIDGLLPEALAWIPQSTVANYIDRVWLNIHKNLPEVQVLLQVHDSLCGQFPTHRAAECIAAMKAEAAKVIVPYDDPLVIPVGIKVSDRSWGACE
jgi:DNA polymerase-1